ncbi:MAG: hypothetical protein ACI35S_07620 [Anaeroplasma sp.]
MEISSTKTEKVLKIVLVWLLLLFLAFLLNREFTILSFSGDDLSEYHRVMEMNFFDFVFSTSSNRFRPVSSLFVYLQLFICKNNMVLIQWWNIFSFSLLGLLFFTVSFKISKCSWISLLLSVLFIYSRFSWYNVTQVLGRMENLCLAFIILIIYFMYNYQKTKERRWFWLSLVFYFLIIFSHERYFILFIPCFIFYAFSGKTNKEKIIFSLSFILSFFLYYYFKTIILKMSFAVDTGGQETITIDIIETLKKSVISLLNVFQLPISSDYLVGIVFDDMDVYHQIFAEVISFLSFGYLIIFLINFIYCLIKKKYNEAFSLNVILVIMMAFLIGTVSTSMRVEMRFLYSSYAVFLISIAYNYNFIKTNYNKIWMYSIRVLSILFGILTFVFSIYMTEQSYPFYYIHQQNSLANYWYDSIYRIYLNNGSNKKVAIIIDNDDYYSDLNNYLLQFDFSKGFIIEKNENDFIDTLNLCLKESSDELLIFYYTDNKILFIEPSEYYEDTNERWLEGTKQSILCFSTNGKISLEFYINTDLLNMNYCFYINDQLIGQIDSFTNEDRYEFIYESDDINNQFFYFTIACEEPYKPYENGGQDIRDLLMYFLRISCDLE